MFKLIFGIVKYTVFACLFCLTAWYWLTPPSLPLASARKEAANAAIKQMVMDIRANRGDAKRAVLLHFDNDPTNYVSNNLRKEILSSGILDLEEIPTEDRIRSTLNLRIPTLTTLQDALYTPAPRDVDLVIWGQLTTFETNADGSAVINGTYHLIDPRSLQAVFTGTISTSQGNAEAVEQNAEPPVSRNDMTIPFHVRILAFAFIALLLPLITFPFLRSTAAKRSNHANAVILTIYGAIGGLLAFLMVGGSFATPLLTALFFIAFIANVVYDLAMLSFATRLEE